MSLTEIAENLIQWLRTQSFTPQPRIVQLSSGLPPAAYPCLSVKLLGERFTNAGTDSEAVAVIRVECAAGRLAEAQAQARGLARQVRAALHKSHGLAGAARQLRTEGIDYGQQAGAGMPAVASAELRVALLG